MATRASLFMPPPALPRPSSPVAPANPRPSISSVRSGGTRRTFEDFETALRNPNETIYLSTSPVAEDAAVVPGASFETGTPTWTPTPDAGEAEMSFEDAMRGGPSRRPHTPPRTGPSTTVVPPTPSSAASVGRPSISSSRGTPSKLAAIKTNQSLGLDDAAVAPAKRRSIFRSPGTASSPDLATLVRRAKDKGSAPGRQAGKAAAAPPPAPSALSAQTPRGTVSPVGIRRDRAVTHSSDEWERFSTGGASSVSGGGDRMATIAESPRKAGAGAGAGDGGRKTAKRQGLFGRMFGTSNASSTAINAGSPSPPSAKHARPPIPPIPPVPDQHKRSSPRPPPTPPPPLASDVFSAQPASISEPLGSPRITETVSSFAEPPRKSQHMRQPAEGTDDHAPRREPSFSEDVTGILDRIGHLDPARELGLPPSSLSLRGDRGGRERARSDGLVRPPAPQDPRQASTGSTRHSARLSPPLPMLGPERVRPQPDGQATVRPNSTTRKPVPKLDVTPRIDASPSSQHTADMAPTPTAPVYPTVPSPVLLHSPRLGEPPHTQPRLSSLPGSPQPDRPATPRSASTPQTASDSVMPIPASVPLSRSSSSASARRTERSMTPVDDSARSVRLVPSSRPHSVLANPTLNLTSEALAQSRFMNAPWGKQSPRPASIHARMGDPLDVEGPSAAGSPSRSGAVSVEDDEERGRKLACEFLEGDATHVAPDKVAMFLGGPRPVHSVALRYYMQYFDMRGQKLDAAFRDLCAKLHLKAESQEIDRIIEGFSARFFECNPTTVFGTPGVVHTVTGAMLMLNTDLHIADLLKHMSRTDFIRNAMRAIQESMPTRASTPDLVRDDGSLQSDRQRDPQATIRSAPTPAALAPTDAPAPPVLAPPISPPVASVSSAPLEHVKSHASSTTSFTFTKTWELEAEAALKEIYASVRADRILLPIGPTPPSSERHSTTSVNRYPTMRSTSGRSERLTAFKRASMRGAANNPYGSMFSTSDGRLSPASSFAGSIGDYQSFAPTFGFASNLSQAVIKEQEDETHSTSSVLSTSTVDDMTDDELALLGAPWAKEGLLHRKLQSEAQRKLQKKDWRQFFTVIQKGELHLFVFGEGGASSMGGAVGGGNWLSNAKATGEYSLMHTTAMALPKSGYTSSRPHCFTVTSPGGELQLFAAGTDDLVAEWVATVNYWAARTSRQPLQGGVSNMEYGWSRAHVRDGRDDDDKQSVRSARSNLSRLGAAGTYGRRAAVAATPADKIHINEWKPPPHATMPSPLDEEAQLEALIAYVRSLKDELVQHKAVEEAISRLYTPGSKNAIKARENWTAKTRYIHSEVFKYETYVEALRDAIGLRVKRQGERKLERSLQRSMASLHASGDDADADDDDDVHLDDGIYVAGNLRIDPNEDGRRTPVIGGV